MRILVITDPGHPGLRPDDEPLDVAFRSAGATLRVQPWGVDVTPGAFDVVLLRTPWDYFERPDEFDTWLRALPTPVLNPLSTVLWNMDKRYLADLAARGLAQIPATHYLGVDERPTDTDALFEHLGAATLGVVKPTVSGGAFRTRVITRGVPIEWSEDDVGEMIVQEFVPAIQFSGEWSLMVFGGTFSHAVRKLPCSGDFRVQEEHGGSVLHEAPPAVLVRLAEELVQGVASMHGSPAALPYARVDFVESAGGAPLLMELELIEPELFLRGDAGAPGRLVEAVLAYGRAILERRS